MGLTVIYRLKNYNVYQAGDAYIVHNRDLEFSKGHTHITNYKAAKIVIKLAIKKKMPYDLHPYFIKSLSRITDDEQYKMKLLELLENKKKKQTYANRGNYNCKNRKS